MKNYPIKIETGEHAGETVWVHRSIAVAGFVFCKIDGVYLPINEAKVLQILRVIGIAHVDI